MKSSTNLQCINNDKSSFEGDLQRIISLVRQRESSLTILLEQKMQKKWQRPDWLFKETQYQQKQNKLSRQIRAIIIRWVLLDQSCNFAEQLMKFIHQFWIKIKIVMKMSLERMKLLNLLNLNLFEHYQRIIQAVNTGYDRAAGIQHFRGIEQMIKQRNKQIHQILGNFTKAYIETERSEPSIRPSIIKDLPIQFKSNKKLAISKRNKENATIINPKTVRRPLSHQYTKSKFRSKQLIKMQKMKNIKTFMERYEHNLADVMQAKLDVNIDIKKNVQQNIEELFDQIMHKNISNHRIICKFAFSHSGYQFKKRQLKRVLKPIQRKILSQNQTPKLIRKQKRNEKFLITCAEIKYLKFKKRQHLKKAGHSNIFETQMKLQKNKKNCLI